MFFLYFVHFYIYICLESQDFIVLGVVINIINLFCVQNIGANF